MNPTKTISISLILLPLLLTLPDRVSGRGPGPLKARRTLKLSELTPQVIQDQLQLYLSSPSNKLREKAAEVIDLSRVRVETEGFNKDPKNAQVRITYELKPGKTDSPAIKEMVNTMVMNFFKETLERQVVRAPVASEPSEVKQPVKPQPIKQPIGPPPVRTPVVSASPDVKQPVKPQPIKQPVRPLPPHLKGLSSPAVEVVSGYFPGEGSISLSAEDSFDVAYACYIRGLYEDAVVLADRGLAKQKDARLLLVKGVCQLHLDRGAEAERTAAAYRSAIAKGQNVGLAIAQERINDGMSSRFWSIGQGKPRS